MSFVLPSKFREAKVTTTREVQNRATDQQGSTTEASDKDSDPGSCVARDKLELRDHKRWLLS